jgi:hypothetical protein
LFFVSRLLNPTRSVASIVCQAFSVAVNSLQPDSHVSTSMKIGNRGQPFDSAIRNNRRSELYSIFGVLFHS